MRDEDNPSRASLEGSNVPGNPLRSFRMSMLAHGFLDRDKTADFRLDESDRLTYGIVRRVEAVPMAGTIVMGIIVAAVVVAAFVFD